MAYRVEDDSVTVRGRGHPEFSGKSVTVRGEERRNRQGPEPGRYDVGTHGHPEKEAGKSTVRDISSVRPQDPVSRKMPTLV
jgi:hypothetical protein